LRGLAGKRQALCRCVRIAPTVSLVEYQSRETGETRLGVEGVMSCGSVWSCPICARRIMTVRAQEIQAAVSAHGRSRVYMLSLTMRHAHGDSLALLAGMLATAYGALKSGRVGRELRRLAGWIGDVRSAEQTHGRNGWHPHLHALWFVDTALSPDAELALSLAWARAVERTATRVLVAAERGNEALLAKLVGQRVARELGCAGVLSAMRRARITPDLVHGCRVSRVTDGAYLAKMGLSFEAAFGAEKRAKKGHRSAWQIAEDAAAGDPLARALWSEHHLAMRGRRQLTWSRGIRAALGLTEELEDQSIAADIGPCEDEDSRQIATVSHVAWDAMAAALGQEWYGCVVAAWERGRLHRLPGVQVSSLVAAGYRARPVDPVLRADPQRAFERAARRWTVYSAQLAARRRGSACRRSLEERELALEECRHRLHELGLYPPPKCREPLRTVLEGLSNEPD